ncbi:MAG: nucleotide exchange factor GrpE [Bacillota bacterium]
MQNERDERDQACECEQKEESREELEARCEEYLQRLMRAQADFQNYRKRVERQRRQLSRDVQAETVEQFLPVIDNLRRVMATADGPDPVRDGVALILDQVEAVLNRFGVSQMTTVGEPFDPHWHEAVGAVPSDEFPDGTVVEELLPGYRMGDRLLRAAQVMVATKVSFEGEEDCNEKEEE